MWSEKISIKTTKVGPFTLTQTQVCFAIIKVVSGSVTTIRRTNNITYGAGEGFLEASEPGGISFQVVAAAELEVYFWLGQPGQPRFEPEK